MILALKYIQSILFIEMSLVFKSAANSTVGDNVATSRLVTDVTSAMLRKVSVGDSHQHDVVINMIVAKARK